MLWTLLRRHGRRYRGAVAAVVVAVPDESKLDKPVACVVLVPGTAVTTADLVAFCRDELAAFKRPRHILVFDEMPTTATGKLQRFRVRELALERLGGSARPDLAPAAGGPA